MDNDQARELKALEGILRDPSAEPIRLSYGLLKFITGSFSNEIGRGGFGVVYKGDLENEVVAVKTCTNNITDKQFMDEIEILKSANHENIVRFLGYCAEKQEEIVPLDGKFVMAGDRYRLLCFEYVPEGNIREYLERDKPHGENWHARYQMIRGICQGLQHLHDKKIYHRDLKPENVMLDAHMKAKITDFGLSRFLDQGKSKMITEHLRGTPRYIAPEVIDNKEISFKSDIYALGIIIIELLTGISMISLPKWYEELDIPDCPRARTCAGIARYCTDAKRENRPDIGDVIRELDELESMIPKSSINKVTRAAFPGTELVDVYPLELSFPFVPNQEMHCHLSVTNKTDGVVYCTIVSDCPDRYQGGFEGLLPPMSTTAITLRRDAEEELPSDTDELEVAMLITGCDIDAFGQKMSTLPGEDKLKAIQELPGFELHSATLTAIAVVSEDDDRALVVDTLGHEDTRYCIWLMDVHPTEPWVLLTEDYFGNIVCIWNMQTKERMGIYEKPVVPAGEEVRPDNMLAKFIPRKQWVVIGNSSGSILVCTAPRMDLVMQFKAHRARVTLLTVHPNRPFLLSYSHPLSLKLWDWDRGWSCIGIFEVTIPVRTVRFNPQHTTTFATRDDDGMVKMWRIGRPDPVATTHELDGCMPSLFFTYTGDQHLIAAIGGNTTNIWDLQKEKHVHTLRNIRIEETGHELVDVVCHPTRPILVTASKDGSIRVWDSTTYRLKKTYMNLPENPWHIGFIGLKRLVIGYRVGISTMDIDLE